MDNTTMKGIVCLTAYDKKHKELWTFCERNLIVHTGYTATARALVGDPAGVITKIAVGTNNAYPTKNDTSLTDAEYINVSGHSFPDSRTVRFNFTIGYDEAVGKNINELGLVTSAGLLFSRKVRKTIEKTSDMTITGYWDISIMELSELPSNFIPALCTGTIMGKGSFVSSDSALLPSGEWGIAILLTTPTDITTECGIFYNHSQGLNAQLSISGGCLLLKWHGEEYAKITVQANRLYCVVLGYDRKANQPALYVNGKRVSNYNVTNFPREIPDIFNVGTTLTGKPFAGKIHSCRLFNFDPSAYASAIWNGGHPEEWRVPDVYRNIPHTMWPTESYTPSQGTWRGNALSMTAQNNVEAANGFSGPFQKWTNGTGTRVSVYNEWRLQNQDTDLNRYQLVEFEYRCDAPLRAAMGSKVYGEWAANTGGAVKVSYVAPSGEYTNLDLVGTSGTFLEIRTLRIVTLGCILDLSPEGLLGNVWRDISGQGVDIPYVPATGNPATVEFSYANVGYRDTVTGESAPVVSPDFVGQTYIDTVNRNIYRAVGTTSAADWKNI